MIFRRPVRGSIRYSISPGVRKKRSPLAMGLASLRDSDPAFCNAFAGQSEVSKEHSEHNLGEALLPSGPAEVPKGRKTIARGEASRRRRVRTPGKEVRKKSPDRGE